MKTETRKVPKEFFICEHCNNEYDISSEAEMCEVECIRKRIRNNCKHNWTYSFKPTGIDEITLYKNCTCGECETIIVDLCEVSEKWPAEIGELLFVFIKWKIKVDALIDKQIK